MDIIKSFAPALAAGGISTLVNQIVLEDESSLRQVNEILSMER